MSTRKTLLGEQQHGDEAAALPPPPEAHPAGAPTESLRQADEPPSEATLSPNPSHPDGPAGTAGALTSTVRVYRRPGAWDSEASQYRPYEFYTSTIGTKYSGSMSMQYLSLSTFVNA